MKEKVKVIVADPAGNVTIFVKTPFAQKDYAQVAKALLAREELRGEQVAFIKEIRPEGSREASKMEMCGLEFCGNASRSFGLITVRERGICGEASVPVSVSGCEEILDVQVNTENGWTKIKMPLPLSCTTVSLPDAPDGQLVDMGGILHLVVRGIPASLENFEALKSWLYARRDAPAIGVMFLDGVTGELTPIVYVKDVDTTYVEGSCGSGTTACGMAFSQGKSDGEYRYSLRQPAGTIDVTAQVRDGQVCAIYIEGPVSLSEEMEVELERD